MCCNEAQECEHVTHLMNGLLHWRPALACDCVVWPTGLDFTAACERVEDAVDVSPVARLFDFAGAKSCLKSSHRRHRSAADSGKVRPRLSPATAQRLIGYGDLDLFFETISQVVRC